MTKSQLITSAIFACLSNSIGSFFISTKSVVETQPLEDIVVEPQIKKSGWSSGFSLDSLKEIIAVIPKSAEEIKNSLQSLDYVQQIKVFGQSFGLCTLFSTFPAVVTTYLDQKYLLTQELPNSGLLKYSVAGVSSAAISGLLTNFAPQVVSSTGLTFQPLSFYNQMIFASLSGIQACGFKAIQEWEEDSEKQQIIIIYNNSELGDASLKDFINSLEN